jgi:hypothetical protein
MKGRWEVSAEKVLSSDEQIGTARCLPSLDPWSGEKMRLVGLSTRTDMRRRKGRTTTRVIVWVVNCVKRLEA